MQDFEIRYFHANGTLALIQMTTQASEHDARELAQHNLGDHASFEIRTRNGTPFSTR
jgi:hypothetical protein